MTLDSIWSQTILPAELILIDDGDLSAATIDHIARACEKNAVAFRFRRSGRMGLTRARNRAATIATAEVLLFLDDDVTCDPRCIEEISAVMIDPRVAAATAQIEEPAFAASRSARLYQLGYRVAGWWAVRPRPRIGGLSPAVLCDPSIALPARWLSGAAMAIRRDVLLQNPFDEALSDYALGEDRELSYRLAPRHWLVEAVRARVVHRREAGGRGDARRFGFMTAHNYICILNRTCRLGAGDWLLVAWGLCVLAMMHVAWAVLGDRRMHLAQLRGMCWGVIAALAEVLADRCDSSGRRPRRPYISKKRRLRGAIYSTDNCNTSSAETANATSSDEDTPTGWWHGQTMFARASDRALRALFVTNRLEHGGAERMLLTLARRLPAEGIRPIIACLQDAGPLADECRALEIPVYDRVLEHKTDINALWRLHDLRSAHRADLIVAAHSGGDRMFWSTLAGRALGVPVVVWSHWHPTAVNPHFEYTNRALYRWVDAYVALGEAHRRALARHAHVPAGRIRVIHNGIEIEPILQASRAAARKQLELSRDEVAVAMIANLRREKRQDVFIRAAAEVAKAHPRTRFFLIGDGSNRDAVLQWVHSSRLSEDHLRLLGARNDVADLMPGLDVVCLCSEIECFSIVMLEAAAAACCFIGPAVGSMGEFLRHRETGLVVRPADPVSLAENIAAAVSDSSLRAALGAAAQHRVRQSFTSERMAKQFADLFRSLVMTPDTRRPSLRR